jgi:hypothetical protein
MREEPESAYGSGGGKNLAALFAGLGLAQAMHGQLGEMAKQCFRWICRRHQMKVDNWHACVIMLKNTAYAWRQMVFFLALLPENAVADLQRWADDHLCTNVYGVFTNHVS